jgi:quercetin dioxygenase-like cupin family protein
MRKLTLFILGAAIVVTALFCAKPAMATPPDGFTGTTIAQGRFGEINVFNEFIPQGLAPAWQKPNIWRSRQRTKNLSDLFVQNNIWQPGGTTGWHTHLGHSLITVTAGTVTVYDGDDPSCTPHVYTAGMGFVDPGGGHVHVIRNEGSEQAQTVAVQLIPAAQPRRIDAPNPGNCPF